MEKRPEDLYLVVRVRRSFRVTVVTMVTFTCMEKLSFLLCNIPINKSYNLRTFTIVYGQIIEWFR